MGKNDEEVEGKQETIQLSPGTLLEVEEARGNASLSWQSKDDMIISMPGFEEGGELLAVAASLILLTIALVTFSS